MRKNHSKRIQFTLLPLLLAVVVLPFVIHVKKVQTGLEELPWIPMQLGERTDFFLYWRGRLLIILAVIMLLVLADWFLIQHKKGACLKKWLPLFIYELFMVLSACFSEYREYAFHGMTEHFESVWVLVGYGILAYYTYTMLQKDRDFAIIGAAAAFVYIAEVMIGLLQMAGHDPLQSGIVKQIMLAGADAGSGGRLLFDFAGEAYQRVYGTFYNPNYAGIFYVMFLPVVAMLFLGDSVFNRCAVPCFSIVKRKLCFGILAFLALLCVIGTGSRSAVAAFFVMIFLWGICEGIRDYHRIWKGCAVLLFCVLVFFCYDIVSGKGMLERFIDGFSLTARESALEEIGVGRDGIGLIFGGNRLSFCYEEDGNALYPVFWDQTGKKLEYSSQEKTQTCTLREKEFEGLTFQCYRKNEIPYIVMEYEGIKWRFTNRTENGCYRYITIWGKPDDIVQADRLLFDGCESLFTNRGYIWSRTLPLLKRYLLLGSGPDSFLLVFPQNDYVARANLGYGFFTEILTKPHCMYLQIAVQTGVLSLLGFLFLLLRYLAGSIKSYYRCGRADMDFGFAIFLAVFSYAVMGLTNDSMLVTAPCFWVLLGMGMKWNDLHGKDVLS